MIERITALTPTRSGTLVGVGDDAAVLAAGAATVLSQDLLVDGVHFRLDATSPFDLGHKAIAVNFSDLAAMGASPLAAVVGIAAPPGLLSEMVDDLYAGMDALAARFDASIVGGDLTRGQQLVLAVAVVGTLPDERSATTRSGARPGETVFVTGVLGSAGAGLRLATEPELAARVPDPTALLAAYHRPWPRVGEGRALADAGVGAMMDISDGLLLDATRLAHASDVQIEIDLDTIPVAPGVAELAQASGLDLHRTVASDGDDYELLVTADEPAAAAARDAGVALGRVGRVLEGAPGLRVVQGGVPVEPGDLGWEHDV